MERGGNTFGVTWQANQRTGISERDQVQFIGEAECRSWARQNYENAHKWYANVALQSPGTVGLHGILLYFARNNAQVNVFRFSSSRPDKKSGSQ